MNSIEEKIIHCPYCGERLEILVDCSVDVQSYIEDCQVCCRPINIDVSIESKDIQLIVRHENE